MSELNAERKRVFQTIILRRYDQEPKTNAALSSASGNRLFLEVRGVENDTHGETANGTSDGDGHNPGEDEKTNSLPVDSLHSSVAETDTHGGTSDAHGGRDGQRVLGEDQDSESSTHLHRTTCFELVFERCKYEAIGTYLC